MMLDYVQHKIVFKNNKVWSQGSSVNVV